MSDIYHLYSVTVAAKSDIEWNMETHKYPVEEVVMLASGIEDWLLLVGIMKCTLASNLLPETNLLQTLLLTMETSISIIY